jgi:signal transduction histidine kinase
MPEMTTIPTEELADLRRRVKKLAEEKSYLQLMASLMEKMSAAQGLENTVETMLRIVLDFIGGINLSVHYRIDEEWHGVDIFGNRTTAARLEDADVRIVSETSRPLEREYDFDGTRMTTPVFTRAITWIYPLLVGPDLVGVFKIEGIVLPSRELQRQLVLFFNYAALILKNEILGYSRLKKANDGLVREITERKRIEAELRESEFQLKESQRIARLGTYRLDVATGSWQSSEVMDEILGIDGGFGRSVDGWARLVHPDQRDAVMRYLTDRVTDGRDFRMDYRIIRDQDGKERWVFSRGRVECGEDGKPARVIGTVFDITERRVAEEKLVRAERMAAVGVLTAGIAHQFNNINTITLAYLQMLESEDGLPEQAKEYVQLCRKAVDRTVQITSRLMILSHPSVSQVHPILVGDFVRAVLRDILPQIEEQEIRLTVELKDVHPVCVDGEKMDFIIKALLSNAMHALLRRADKTIRLETGGGEEETFFRVVDSGTGLPQEQLSSLFTPFFSLKGEHAPLGSAQTNVKGIGLSLAVVHAIVTGHGGRITVERGTEAGLAFTVRLPACPRE